MSSLAAMLKAPGAMVECDDDPEAVYEFLCAKGWSDGLPVIPPTPERVERMLAYCDRDFDQPVAKIPPRFGAATPIRVAANAVMAGCKPEYFPLVLLALEAMAEEPVQPLRHAGDHASLHADADFQRAGREGGRHQRRATT